jgi:hypothetical protein
MKAIAMNDLSALAPARRAAAQPSAALPGAAPARPRRLLAAIGRWLLARLNAHSRRHVALALGEHVDELNQAIRNGAEARRQIESKKENQI